MSDANKMYSGAKMLLIIFSDSVIKIFFICVWCVAEILRKLSNLLDAKTPSVLVMKVLMMFVKRIIQTKKRLLCDVRGDDWVIKSFYGFVNGSFYFSSTIPNSLHLIRIFFSSSRFWFCVWGILWHFTSRQQHEKKSPVTKRGNHLKCYDIKQLSHNNNDS